MTTERALLLLDSKSFYAMQNGRYNIESISFEEARELIKVMDEVGEVARCYSDDGINGFLQSEYPRFSPDEVSFNESAILFHRTGDSYTCKIVTKLDEFDARDFVS